MTTTVLDVRHKRGVNLPFAYVLKDTSGVAYDLTGCTFRASIKDMHNRLVAKLLVTSPNPTAGELLIDPVNTENWPIGDHEWDIDIEHPDGRVLTIPEKEPARWKVLRDITQESD